MSKDNSSLQLEKVIPEAEDFLPILGTDFVELYVGNAKQAAYYYQHAWGFQPVAYSGLETGRQDSVSYVLQQGKIRIVLTSPLQWIHFKLHLLLVLISKYDNLFENEIFVLKFIGNVSQKYVRLLLPLMFSLSLHRLQPLGHLRCFILLVKLTNSSDL